MSLRSLFKRFRKSKVSKEYPAKWVKQEKLALEYHEYIGFGYHPYVTTQAKDHVKHLDALCAYFDTDSVDSMLPEQVGYVAWGTYLNVDVWRRIRKTLEWEIDRAKRLQRPLLLEELTPDLLAFIHQAIIEHWVFPNGAYARAIPYSVIEEMQKTFKAQKEMASPFFTVKLDESLLDESDH